MKTMKNLLLLSLLFVVSTAMGQKPILLNENFTMKMADVKETWSDFEIPTLVAGKEAKFVAHASKYFANSSPAQPCNCSKGRVNIEMEKQGDTPYLQFPELPSCGVLKIGVQANGKDCKRILKLQKQENGVWVDVDQIEVEAPPTGTCVMWEPKNATSKKAIKFRIIGAKGNVYVTDVIAESI